MPTPAQEAAWEKMFLRLANFHRRQGHCRVPLRGADRRLGNWVSNQRQTQLRGAMPPGRRKRLRALGFEFVVNEADWQKMLLGLARFKRQHGHTQVPRHWEEPPGLGVWVTYQRSLHRQGRLAPEHERRLRRWSFDFAPVDPRWHLHYARLAEFYKRHDHCNMGNSGDAFGQWVAKQRLFYREGKLTARQIRQLNAIRFAWVKGGRVSPVAEARWLRNLRALERFKKRHGHCRVPQNQGKRRGLGVWVANTRAFYGRGEPPAERVRALNELGFVWKVTPVVKGRMQPWRE
ncbi:MAG: helicase associated domain-containing protein [Chthoniobacterales bacterium]